MKKHILQHVYDFLLSPLRLIVFPDAFSERIGLTSLRQERFSMVIPEIRGRLLDIGCGKNELVTTYGNGVGVDIFDWGEPDVILVKNTADLPFKDEEFDTVSVIAALNHIPNRGEVVSEINRVLRPGGRFIVTMIDPIIGYVGHKLWWYSEDKERGMEEHEEYGLWNSDIIRMVEGKSFKLESQSKFVYLMNNMLVFVKV